MKKILLTLTAVAAMAVTSATAADKHVKGEALCAKCELKETAKCQDAIRVEEDGKKVVYYVEKNDVTKDLHKKVCSAVIKVDAKGKVSEKDGKKWITLSKLEEVK